MRIPKLLGAVLAVLAASPGRADTIEVTSTTLLNIENQTRGGVPGEEWRVDTVAPAFEILSMTARDLTNPAVDDLTISLSTWGSYELNDPRWDNGTGSDLTGDVVMGYVSGKLLDRRLTLRLGREQVQTGAARMIHLDGGEAIAVLPYGFRVSGYVGVPVSQRFTTRTGVRNWNPLGGDLAYGGRAAWSLALPGWPGRGLDVGASANVVDDDGDPVKQELAADFRLKPSGALVFSGFGAWSVYDERFSEATVRAGWWPTRRLLVEADWRYVAPDLFLARNSILSVFSAEEWHAFGGSATYRFGRGLSAHGAYHLQVEPAATSGASRELGHEALARVDWERGRTISGLEVFVLDSFDNGYVGGRAFGRHEIGRYFLALDVLLHGFREEVNGEDVALTGTASAGVDIAKGFTAVLAGRAGVTPFLERSFDVIAKLAYNQTYRKLEVR